MIISNEKDPILFLTEDVIASLKLLSVSPMGSNSHFSQEVIAKSEYSESPVSCSSDGVVPRSVPLTVTCLYNDSNVEQEKHELEERISSLEEEISQMRLKLKSMNAKRRNAMNRILDIKGSIQVFCRIRPFLETKNFRRYYPVSVESEKIIVKTQGFRKDYSFDKIFTQDASQDDVFSEVVPIIKSALDGHNVCVIAYGQTGTGKTFTMDGSEKEPGIVPRTLKELFNETSLDNSSSYSYSLKMSMLEVYMGSVRDLLMPKQCYKSYETVGKRNLNILTEKTGAVEIEGLTEISIHDFEKAKQWYNKGKFGRSTTCTNVNETSSRSHCLMRIRICQYNNGTNQHKEISKLWMIDLGGSERCLKTGATGHTLDEGRAINLSLSALSDVIAALRKHHRHIPYRNSKLTQILKDSLGVSSKVIMLVHLSSKEEDVSETVCSLNFAKRARAVESDHEISEDIRKQRERKILEIEEEMKIIEEDCQKVTNQLKHAEFLLTANTKVFATKYIIAENVTKGVTVTSHGIQIPKKVLKRSMTDSTTPRFMTSTMASRQRLQTCTKPNTMKSGSRNSSYLKSSQSDSLKDIYTRIPLRNGNKKTRYSETNASCVSNSPKCIGSSDTTAKSVTRKKQVTSLNPALLRTMNIGIHRRRMSALL